MGKALSITWRGIADTYSELFPMVGMNLIWVVISVVLAPILVLIWSPVADLLSGFLMPGLDEPQLASASLELAFILALLTLVFGPNPAYVGTHNYINHLLNDHPVYFGMVWEGFKRYWARAFALFGVSTLAYVILSVCTVFYFSQDSTLVKLLGVVCAYAALLWTMMQMYLLPLLLEQEKKSFRLILRNALLLTMDNAIVTLTLLVVTVALVAVSFAVTILITMITASLLASIQQRATLTLLDKYNARGAPLTR